jgi:hypothetical protein
MSNKEPKTFMVEDAQLIYRNFEGKEGPYNRAGDKNFSVILDEESAQQMLVDGWNVRYREPKEEGDEAFPYISVAVRFDVRPPTVIMITSSGRVALDDESVAVLDWARIQTADMIARAYEWTFNGKTGIKAYLQSLYVTIEEDALERKYNSMGTN